MSTIYKHSADCDCTDCVGDVPPWLPCNVVGCPAFGYRHGIGHSHNRPALHVGDRQLDHNEAQDMLDSIPDLQSEVAQYKRVLRAIASLCNAPHWTSERRWKIEALASGREKPVR